MRKTVSPRPSGDWVIKVSLVLAATVLAFLIGTVVGSDRTRSETLSEFPQSKSEAGILNLPEFGLTVRYPSEWQGEDTKLSGNDVRYEKGQDWTIHSYKRQEGVQAQTGQGPTLLVRIVTSNSEAGKAELSAYFEMLSNLTTAQPSASYDVLANQTAQMTLAGSSSGKMLAVRSLATDVNTSFVSQAYYKLSRGRLYVVAYVRSSSEQIAVDRPLIEEILASVSITD
jgi:hypothetical protein